MKHISFGIKTLSVFLAVLLFAMAIPLGVFAYEAEEDIHTENTPTEENPVLTSTLDEAFEVTSLREETVKHFRLSDGSYMAFQYDSAVHIADNDGNWQDIDNHLTESGSELTSMDARIKFVKKITGNDVIFTLHEGNRKLTTSLDGAIKKTVGEAINTETSFDESATLLQKLTTLDHLSTKVIYRNILDGVDLEYLVNGRNIKENLIVKNKDAGNSFSFTLKLNNMIAVLGDDGAVYLMDGDSVCYIIPAPTVWDADGVYADEAYYTLETIGNGTYRLQVTVSDAWMSADDRAYPVTVDPPIYANTSANMLDTYIYQGNTATSYGAATSFRVGEDTNSYTMVGFFKMTTLPTLPKAATVVSSNLNLYCTDYMMYTTGVLNIGLYAATSSWTESSTWSGLTAYQTAPASSKMIDYACLDTASENTTVTWDMTELTRAWYDGTKTNYGVYLYDVNCVRTSATFASREATSNRPVFDIQYRVINGIEDYYSYRTQSAGLAGTGYVNMATGNLTLAFSGYSTDDGLMPYTPTLVYNSLQRNQYFNSNFTSTTLTPSAGLGWKLDFDQSVKAGGTVDGRTYYIWVDADGTEHAFIPFSMGSGTVYYDEDGLGLEFKITTSAPNGMYYQICDTHGNIIGFDTNGDLVKEIDSFGNQRIYTRSNRKVTSVSLKPNGGSAIEQVRFSYYTSGTTSVLTGIEYVGTNKRIRLYYSKSATGTSYSQSSIGYLRQVEYCRYSGGTYTVDATATYTYTSAGLLSVAKDLFSNYYIRYAYSSNKVTTAYEYSASTLGQTVGFTYSSGKTTYRTSGSDDAYSTADDLLTHFVFDNACRTITTYMTDLNNKTVYGASTSDYIDLPTGVPTSEQAKQNNKLDTTANINATSPNLISNGGFEKGTTSGWTTGYSATLTAASIAKNHGRYGAAIRFGSSQLVAQALHSVYLTEGTYTFSMNVRLRNTPPSTATIKLDTPSGTTSVVASNTLSYTSTTPKSIKFTQIYTTFTVPADNTYTLSVSATRSSSSATVYFDIDDAVLIKGSRTGQISMLENGGFENGNDGSWIDGYNMVISSTAAHTGRYGVSMNSSLNNHCFALQEISLLDDMTISYILDTSSYAPNEETKSYILSGWAKANAVKQRDDRLFGLEVWIGYAKPGAELLDHCGYFVPFNTDTSEWQFASLPIITDPTLGYPATMEIYLVFSHNNGTAWFDDVTLIESTDTVDYTYDSEGRVTMSENGNGYDTQEVTYYTEEEENGDIGDIKTVLYNDGRVTSYTYVNHKVLSCVTMDANNQVLSSESITYNTYGLPTTVLSGGNGTEKFKTLYTYSTDSAIFGKVLTTTDTTGLITTYHYDMSTRYLMAVTNSDGVGTAYTYDALGRQISAKPATVTASGYQAESGTEQAVFAYTENVLSSITTGSTTYSFTYDVYKNRKSVKVGSGDIAYYIYNAQNGKLIYTVYANGYVTKNVYDELDRIKEVWYTTISGTLPTTDSAYDGYTYSRKETYRYDEAGNVAEIIDYIDSTSTVYVYDTDGRPIHAVRYDKKSGTVTAEFAEEVTYNSVGLVSKSGYEYLLNGAKYTETRNYVYDSQQRLSAYYYGATTSSADKYTYTYDGLSRLTNRTLTYGGLTVSQTYGYALGSNSMDSNNATGRISSVASKVGSATTNYSYTYDDRGNITHIYIGGVLKYSYEYDNLNQLTRENNAVANKTYVYTYDDAGNILTKKTYAYTTGTLGSVQSTNRYGYTNAEWGDQLTTFNGVTMSYDALGNPTKYFNGSSFTLTWEKGRLLTNVKSTITYTYNADGIRTGKNLDGTAVEYVLDGTKILAEKNGDMVITYIYDPQGAPVGMRISGTTYLYEKNLQGDVIGIYTTGGTKVATYVYDAWGKLISSSYTSGYYTPYYYNPFRYRGYYYDIETGFYYLQSRYYDPTTGRFLNADIHINANGDLQGYNMYAYCSNNPIMYVDYTGEFLERLSDFVVAAWSRLKNIFGAESSTTKTIDEDEVPIIPDPSPITITTGSKITQTVTQRGDSSKPISVYANGDLQDPIDGSSVGVRINDSNYTYEFDIGYRNINITFMHENGNRTWGGGLVIDFSKLKIGLEGFSSVQQGNITEKTYTNVSVSVWTIVAVYCLATTGQMVPCPA